MQMLLQEQGYQSLEKIAEVVSEQLTEKQKEDEDDPKKLDQRNNFWMHWHNW